jgi:hypothetical protein
MNAKAEVARNPVDVRLKKLRRERYLVERAIIALTEISRTRQSRDRRAIRN